jgi:NET1-associated nuclear protein 1 (U3 small nucleolar RNA-associated protein 17)
MTVASMESGGRRRDIVFTTEIRKDGGWRITANELAPPNGPIKTDAKTIYTSNQRTSYLKTANEGSVIVAASEKKVLIGRLRSTDYATVDKIKYEFFSFASIDRISCLDVRVRERPGTEELKSSKMRRTPIVDVVVGDVKGTIFVHNDILANLIRSQSGTLPAGISLIPRKLHWHRQAVHTVKWSLDGKELPLINLWARLKLT